MDTLFMETLLVLPEEHSGSDKAAEIRKREKTPIRGSARWSLQTPRIWRAYFLPNPVLQSYYLAEPWPVQRRRLAKPSKLPSLKPWIWRRIILPNPGMRGPFENAQDSSGTKNQPKEEVFGRMSLRTSGQKVRSGPPNPGRTSTLTRTLRADVHDKTSVWKTSSCFFVS